MVKKSSSPERRALLNRERQRRYFGTPEGRAKHNARSARYRERMREAVDVELIEDKT
jgi:hypothetical protein